MNPQGPNNSSHPPIGFALPPPNSAPPPYPTAMSYPLPPSYPGQGYPSDTYTGYQYPPGVSAPQSNPYPTYPGYEQPPPPYQQASLYPTQPPTMQRSTSPNLYPTQPGYYPQGNTSQYPGQYGGHSPGHYGSSGPGQYGSSGPAHYGGSPKHKTGILDKAGALVTGGLMGGGLMGGMLAGKHKKISKKKALKYGIPIAGAGLGAYALKKTFHRRGSSSSSSSSD